MPKVFLFIAFLVAYALWAWACVLAARKANNDLLTGRWFWSGQYTLMVGYAGFFGFIYLLSGWWSWQFAALFFVAAQLGTLVAFLVNVILGAQSEESAMRVVWAGKELDLKYPRASKLGSLLVGLIGLSYPILAGIVFFRHTWGSEPLRIMIVKYSLLLLILGGYCGSVGRPQQHSVASQNLDESTRQRIFVEPSRRNDPKRTLRGARDLDILARWNRASR